VIKVLTVCLLASTLAVGQTPDRKNLRTYLESNNLNPIEGIWNTEISQEFYHYDTLYDVKNLGDTGKVYIVADNDRFVAYFPDGESYNIEFTTTDVKGVYMYRVYYPLISNYSKKQAVICTHGKMDCTYDLPTEYAIKVCGEDYQPDTRVVYVMKWKKIFPVTQ
jgi:hypothetical protein